MRDTRASLVIVFIRGKHPAGVVLGVVVTVGLNASFERLASLRVRDEGDGFAPGNVRAGNVNELRGKSGGGLRESREFLATVGD
jgi:hypothetical protein